MPSLSNLQVFHFVFIFLFAIVFVARFVRRLECTDRRGMLPHSGNQLADMPVSQGFGETNRIDRWWMEPLWMGVALTMALVYTFTRLIFFDGAIQNLKSKRPFKISKVPGHGSSKHSSNNSSDNNNDDDNNNGRRLQ